MITQATIHPRIAGCRRAVPALLAAVLVLGGCAATYVDDTWQCPLAQGTACTSVAEADPAVTSPVKEQFTKRGLPRDAESAEAGESAPGCVGGCDPLAWLAGLFGGSEERGDVAAARESKPVSPSERVLDAAGENLRTEERIARIWIAPFVDAEGVYREGHWVRTVLEPARWRLP